MAARSTSFPQRWSWSKDGRDWIEFFTVEKSCRAGLLPFEHTQLDRSTKNCPCAHTAQCRTNADFVFLYGKQTLERQTLERYGFSRLFCFDEEVLVFSAVHNGNTPCLSLGPQSRWASTNMRDICGLKPGGS